LFPVIVLLSLVTIEYGGWALLGSSLGHRHDHVADLGLAEVSCVAAGSAR
jgi:hypothetical protein